MRPHLEVSEGNFRHPFVECVRPILFFIDIEASFNIIPVARLEGVFYAIRKPWKRSINYFVAVQAILVFLFFFLEYIVIHITFLPDVPVMTK